MNIHESARQILAMPESPKLRTGLCAAIPDAVGAKAGEPNWIALHSQCGAFMPLGETGLPDVGTYLPDVGVWTEQRLNAICLLAVSEAEDFEQVGPTEAEMLVAAGFTTEEATAAVKARIAAPQCYGPWDGVEPVYRWLLWAFDWEGRRWLDLYGSLKHDSY